ncbi:proline-rich protein 18 [Chiloscyllium plagiosum]|uniref:proline-rich protein 18 n=1 Tax=Chiloscyllium plagiosum TaxID=36176 RepID=UPI001CB7C31D|nr:proline-rich protein 18 [Chiloscyllium plagiosum]
MKLESCPRPHRAAVSFPAVAPAGGCCIPGRQQEMVRGPRAGPAPPAKGRGRSRFSTSRLGGLRPQAPPAGPRAPGSSSESGPASRSADSGRGSSDTSPRSGPVDSTGEGGFSLSLTPEAMLLIQRRSLELQPLGAGRSRRQGPRWAAAADIRGLVKISLLNNQHKYDDVEYEEEEEEGGPGDPALHQRCLDWLHGVQEAATRPRTLS